MSLIVGHAVPAAMLSNPELPGAPPATVVRGSPASLGTVASIYLPERVHKRRHGLSNAEFTPTQARRIHAAGQHPYRRLALSRRLAGHEFQLRASSSASLRSWSAAKFDAFFMADHMAVLNMPIEALKRSHTVTSFEPFTLLSALPQVTEHIGLVATGSTTFDAPYHVARRFASLDHISGGRAGWNIVTTSNPDAALNFGLDEHDRARRALSPRARVLRRGDRPVGQLGRRRLHPRRRERHLFRSGQAARARSQGRISIGARPAQHRAAGAGLAGDRPGRRLRCRPPARGRDRRSGVHRAGQSRGRARRSMPM